ncbi:MAG: hypothetical protein ACON3Z_16950 [Bradymonadia bacterium]
MRRLACLIAGLLFTGCMWTDGSGYDNAVFAEDGEAVALVYQEFKKKNSLTHIKRKDHKTQVVIGDSPETYEVITPLLQGDVIDLFYQLDAGYILLGRKGEAVDTGAGNWRNWHAYDHIDLRTGQVTALDEQQGMTTLSCDGGTSAASTSPILRMVPNPSGSIIARFAATTSCNGREYTVSFLNADTQSPLGEPHTITETAMPEASSGPLYWQRLDLAWTEDGGFGVSDWSAPTMIDHVDTVVYFPSARPSERRTQHFSCISTPTLSANTRPDGRYVSVDTETGELHFSEEESEFGFGCR